MTAAHSPGIRLNYDIASRLEELARLLDGQRASPFRVQAYEAAAATVRQWPVPMDEIWLKGGLEELNRLPHIGEVIARAIRDLVLTGRLPMLERLRGESDPVATLASVPGLGRALADRVHERLHLGTLEELEAAAYDGRLARLEGFGDKRLLAVRESLGFRLGRVRPPSGGLAPLPPVAEILDVDREYRDKCHAGVLHRIAPRRFNPTREAWLPILHTTRGATEYTALFSNTARAHQLGRTGDWVVLYFNGRGNERQCTVVTARQGHLRGKRIVRGREAECARHYAETRPQRNRRIPANPSMA